MSPRGEFERYIIKYGSNAMSDQNMSCSPGETMVFSYLSRTLQSSDQLLTVCACHWRLYHETAPLRITNIVGYFLHKPLVLLSHYVRLN